MVRFTNNCAYADSSLKLAIESNFHQGLRWDCFNTVYGWSRIFALLCQPIKCKTEATESPAFSRDSGSVPAFTWVLINSLWYFPLFWLAFVISLVLFLPHSIEKRSNRVEWLASCKNEQFLKRPFVIKNKIERGKVLSAVHSNRKRC